MKQREIEIAEVEMGDDYGHFSLLWEEEESYREWRENLDAKDRGYIDDLNLRFVYEEICRAGRFGEQYNFAEIFLHPCARVSTVVFRQKIMEQLYQDTFLNEAAVEFVSCVSEIQQRLERFDGKAAEKDVEAERVAAAKRIAAARKAALTGNIAVVKECNLTEYLTKRTRQHGIVCDEAGNGGKAREIKGYSEFYREKMKHL